MAHSPFVVAVSNRKGGTGKTTTAVNLAAEFALQGKSTLLIDMDSQGHVALGLGVALEKNAHTAHHVFSDASYDLLQAIRPTPIERLSLVPADCGFEHVDVRRDFLLLARQLRRPEVTRSFERIVIDTPPTQDMTLMNAITAAHGVVVPLLAHHLAREGVRQLSRIYGKVAFRYNPLLRHLAFLPVMVNPHIKMHDTVMKEVIGEFGAERMLRGIRSDVKLAESFAAGQPVQLFAPKSRGAMDYHLLAAELGERWGFGA